MFFLMFFVIIDFWTVIKLFFFTFETFFNQHFQQQGPSEHPLLWMKDPCINIKYSSSSRHFTLNYFNQSQIWNLYCLDLSVKVFPVMESQFNKQSVDLSILLTLSKCFTDPKFVFNFDLISSSGKNCLFLAFLQLY